MVGIVNAREQMQYLREELARKFFFPKGLNVDQIPGENLTIDDGFERGS